jgi:hypothetical protein
MELTRTLTLLLLLALSASAQTPRIPPPESVNRNGLVGRWLVPGYQTGNGLTPTQVRDASGSGNHGATVSAPNYGLIFSRPAMTFNGTNQYVEFSQNIIRPTAMTITLWCRVVTAAGFVLSNNDTDSKNRFYLYLYTPTQQINYGWRFDNSGGSKVYYVPNVLPIGRWFHLVVVVDPAGGTHGMYVDGVRVHSNSQTYTIGTIETPTRIASNGWTPANELAACDVNDFRIYNRVLSAEISAMAKGLQ